MSRLAARITSKEYAARDYRIAISNKLYRPAELRVRVQGLPEGSYRLAPEISNYHRPGANRSCFPLRRICRAACILSWWKFPPLTAGRGDFQIQHFSGQG